MRSRRADLDNSWPQPVIDVRPPAVSSLARLDVTDNVNRWRGQAGLPPADEDQIRKEAVPLEVDGAKGLYFDLDSSGGEADGR